jgi:hypothetical protein
MTVDETRPAYTRGASTPSASSVWGAFPSRERRFRFPSPAFRVPRVRQPPNLISVRAALRDRNVWWRHAAVPQAWLGRPVLLPVVAPRPRAHEPPRIPGGGLLSAPRPSASPRRPPKSAVPNYVSRWRIRVSSWPFARSRRATETQATSPIATAAINRRWVVPLVPTHGR